MDQNFTTWWPLKTVVGRLFLIARAPGGTTDHLLVKKEWPKIKIYADSWVEQWERAHSVRILALRVEGVHSGQELNNQVITVCKVSAGPRQPPLCHQSSQCLNTRHNEQSHHSVQRMEAMRGSGYMSSHLLRLAREINADSHVQHHPFRRLTSHLVAS